MKKAIYEFDAPASCSECEMMFEQENGCSFCVITMGVTKWHGRRSDCPLKIVEMPKENCDDCFSAAEMMTIIVLQNRAILQGLAGKKSEERIYSAIVKSVKELEGGCVNASDISEN